MTIPNNRLFSAASLQSLLSRLEDQLEIEMSLLDVSDLSKVEMEEFINQLESRYHLKIPVLNRKDVHRSEESDCRVDVRRDQSRMVSDRTKPCMVDGKRVVISIPFTGDARLLLQNPGAPNGFSAVMATVEKETVDLEYKRPLPIDTALLERDVTNDLNALESNLTWVRNAVDLFNRNFPQTIRQKLGERQTSIEAGKAALDGLSIPVRLRKKEPAISAPLAPTAPHSAPSAVAGKVEDQEYKYDVFICHASEDKEEVAKPIANALLSKRIRVWYDEFSLELGDSLRRKIDEGLKQSQYGIVILSPHFFEKQWPQYELDGLVTREMHGVKVILPIWHKVGSKEVQQYSPSLAGKVAANTVDMTKLLEQILKVLGKTFTVPSGAHYDSPGSYWS